ncbi:hypothetical protein DERF_002799 [Dermatophagoides farinae]|uniref:Uncharacterized protein n=1 Tax=Dermatophagoides farinae TaxID=6954 RepID=A0A922IEE1_DERFA|nr:hypothetical protein DERF_002799 [Dermatophagoides farinae]
MNIFSEYWEFYKYLNNYCFENELKTYWEFNPTLERCTVTENESMNQISLKTFNISLLYNNDIQQKKECVT